MQPYTSGTVATRTLGRRALFAMAAGSLASIFAACGGRSRPGVLVASPQEARPTTASVVRTPNLAADVAPSPSPTTTPVPEPFPAGRESRILLPGTPWATGLTATHSGAPGPSVLILGGVHGNEPGAWLAADELATLQPRAGSLIVLPRANQLAIADFVRTYDELGDLNRLYPGDPSSTLPMARMAAEIVAVASEFRVDVVLDLHESWAFYTTRTQSGTAFLGQTITAGVGPRNPSFAMELVERANAHIDVERDLMVFREGSAFRRPDPGNEATSMRGRSSLSLGGHVPGLTPLLIEMGQEDQPIERRTELHLIVAHEALRMLALL